MKRSLSLISVFALCLAVVGSMASVGLASPRREADKRGFDLGFDGKYKHGRPVKVKNFTYSFFDVSCDNGATAQASNSGSPLPSMKVKMRKFHGTFRSHGMKTAVTGKYNKGLTKVTGTLRVTGKVSGETGCDSGTVGWVTN